MSVAWTFGTSSWSETDWVGPFYPRGTKAGDFLRVYAQVFTTVEADTTYYRVPSAALVRGWAEKTPETFRLCAKFPRSIVHGGEGATPQPSNILDSPKAWQDCEAFLTALQGLGPRKGPVVLQFPYFNRSAFPEVGPFLSRLDAFLARLPADERVAVEVRNKAWLAEPLLALLRHHRACLVLSELPYLPHPADLAPQLDVVTTDWLYVRLIGDREATEAACERFDRPVLNKDASLDRWAQLLVNLTQDPAGRVREVHAYANNHYQGHGPATIRALGGRVQERLASLS